MPSVTSLVYENEARIALEGLGGRDAILTADTLTSLLSHSSRAQSALSILLGTSSGGSPSFSSLEEISTTIWAAASSLAGKFNGSLSMSAVTLVDRVSAAGSVARNTRSARELTVLLGNNSTKQGVSTSSSDRKAEHLKRAAFEFTAESPLELSLQLGEIVAVEAGGAEGGNDDGGEWVFVIAVAALSDSSSSSSGGSHGTTIRSGYVPISYLTELTTEQTALATAAAAAAAARNRVKNISAVAASPPPPPVLASSTTTSPPPVITSRRRSLYVSTRRSASHEPGLDDPAPSSPASIASSLSDSRRLLRVGGGGGGGLAASRSEELMTDRFVLSPTSNQVNGGGRGRVGGGGGGGGGGGSGGKLVSAASAPNLAALVRDDNHHHATLVLASKNHTPTRLLLKRIITSPTSAQRTQTPILPQAVPSVSTTLSSSSSSSSSSSLSSLAHTPMPLITVTISSTADVDERRQAIVLYSFEALEPGEISVPAGLIVELTDVVVNQGIRLPEGWVLVRLITSGLVGFVPKTFLGPIIKEEGVEIGVTEAAAEEKGRSMNDEEPSLGVDEKTEVKVLNAIVTVPVVASSSPLPLEQKHHHHHHLSSVLSPSALNSNNNDGDGDVSLPQAFIPTEHYARGYTAALVRVALEARLSLREALELDKNSRITDSGKPRGSSTPSSIYSFSVRSALIAANDLSVDDMIGARGALRLHAALTAELEMKAASALSALMHHTNSNDQVKSYDGVFYNIPSTLPSRHDIVDIVFSGIPRRRRVPPLPPITIMRPKF